MTQMEISSDEGREGKMFRKWRGVLVRGAAF
jgi:hypothetical protein